MEYLILNEESIPYKTVEEADDRFPVFLKLIDDAFFNNLKIIRATGMYDPGWFEFPLADDYVLREWLEKQEKDYTTRIKSIITKTSFPIIPEDEEEVLSRYELSDFYLKDDRSIQTPSLGATYLLDELAISFSSNHYWIKNLIEVEHYEIEEETGEDITEIVAVNNISEEEHWREHLIEIERQRRESVRSGQGLWDNRVEWFPNLIFCGETENQLKKFSFSASVRNKVWDVLKKMNAFCEANMHENSFTVDNLRDHTGLNISPESETVINNPKFRQRREFRKPDGHKEYFEWHVKNIPNIRLYFQVDPEQKQFFVGYIGKHLRTKRHP